MTCHKTWRICHAEVLALAASSSSGDEDNLAATTSTSSNEDDDHQDLSSPPPAHTDGSDIESNISIHVRMYIMVRIYLSAHAGTEVISN